MSAKVSVYIGVSLDGFIARRDGSIDWLNEASAGVPEGEDCGYQDFMDSVDRLIMGRNTYEQVLSFGQWPYGEKPVVVLSRNLIEFPPEIPKTVTHSSESPEELLKRFSDEGGTHLYIDGGNTVQRFLCAGLVDEITLTVIPVLLGEGISLFGPLDEDVHLEHVRTKAYDFGFVQTTYAVKKKV